MDDNALLLLAVLVDDEFGDEPPKKKKRKPPVVWERPWLSMRANPNWENVFTLQNRLREYQDIAEFRRMTRMDIATYDYLLEKVRADIQKQDTNCRRAINVDQRLATTLRYLAHGHSCPSLTHQYTVCNSSVHRIIDETVLAIIRALADEYLSTPSTQEEWEDVAKVYQCRWNFPNCIGALDGKHVRIRKPDNSGSIYWNYKAFHSVVLMALVDGNYEFMYVDVGGEGRQSDGGIWRDCSMRDAIVNGEAELPGPRRLPGSNVATNYVIVGDDAFRLGPHLVKPFCRRHLTEEERVFNYRLSRARRCSENAFGILVSRFRIFQTEIHASPDRVTNIVLACCALHNLLRRRCGRGYMPPGSIDMEDANNNIIPGEWRKENQLTPIQADQKRNTTDFSKAQRVALKDYFVSHAGSVPWQLDSIK